MANAKNIFSVFIAILLVFGLSMPGDALAKKHKKSEKEYQREWCDNAGGIAEKVMPDGSRCDCETADYAIEFDFGPKWAEAVGQALYYSLQTGKKAGIVLILESEKDNVFWLRLNSTIKHFKLPIKTWYIKNY